MEVAGQAQLDVPVGYALRLCRWTGISLLAVAAVTMHAWRVHLEPAVWAAVVLAGVSLSVVARVIGGEGRSFIVRAVVEAAAYFSVSWLTVSCLEPVVIRHAALPWAGQALVAALDLTTPAAIGPQGEVLIRSAEGALSVLPTAQVLGLPYWGPFLAAVLVSVVFWRDGLRRAAWLAVIIAVMEGAYASFTIAQYADVVEVLSARLPQATGVFERPLALLGALLITGSLMALVSGRRASHALSDEAPATAAASLSIAALAIAFLCAAELPGEEKQGRVLIDDRLSQYWEPAARRLDEGWFGDFSTYSFAAATELLAHHFAVTVNQSQLYSDDFLRNYDVVVLKTPRVWLDTSEEEAIQRFVEAGGGLLLISDHTDLMGMSTRLNRLASIYGMTFRSDSVGGMKDGSFSVYRARALDTHPVVSDVRVVETMTGCSIDLDWGLRHRPIMTVPAQACQSYDYATPSFFGSLYSDAGQPFGEVVLGASSTHGEGRVIAFADSTATSSFALFTWGRDTFLYGMLSYLNVRAWEAWELIRPIALAGLVGCCCWMVWRMARRSRIALALGISSCAWLSAPAGLFLARALSQSPGRVLSEDAAVGRQAVVLQGCESLYPPVLGDLGGIDPDQCFDTFLSAIPRTGVMPLLCSTLSDAWPCGSILFMGPQSAPTAAELEQLRAWTIAGGSLLVAVRNDHHHIDAVRALLAPFDVSVSDGGSGLDIQGLGKARSLRDDIRTYAGSFGRGSVNVLLGLEQLSRKRLGHAFETPTRVRRAAYDTLYEFVTAFGRLRPLSRRIYAVL